MKFLDHFIKKSAFKILAMADINITEYKLVLYLLNCTVSGFEKIITSYKELSESLNLDIVEIERALDHLFALKMIHFKVRNQMQESNQSFALSLNLELDRWKINDDHEHPEGAVIFPFQKIGHHLHLISKDQLDLDSQATVDRIFETYQMILESTSNEEIQQNRSAAKLLAETHSVDQVLLLIRFFKERIPSLSLLASSWQHYTELYEQENQSIDFVKIRKEHEEKDWNVKKAATKLLSSSDLKLSKEEVEVLSIIAHHKFPRRQLFWAYQSRSRYPKLKEFFKDNEGLMLAVTNTGSRVRRPDS